MNQFTYDSDNAFWARTVGYVNFCPTLERKEIWRFFWAFLAYLSCQLPYCIHCIPPLGISSQCRPSCLLCCQPPIIGNLLATYPLFVLMYIKNEIFALTKTYVTVLMFVRDCFFSPRASNAMASKGLYEIYPRETMATGRDSKSWSLIFFRVEPSRGLGMGWTKAKGWRWDHQVNFTFPCIMILMERVGRSEVDFTRVAIAWVLESVNRRVRQERLGVSNWSRSAWLMERKRKPKYWKVSCKYLMWLQSAVSALKKLKVNSNFLIYYKWVSTFQHNSVWF